MSEQMEDLFSQVREFRFGSVYPASKAEAQALASAAIETGCDTDRRVDASYMRTGDGRWCVNAWFVSVFDRPKWLHRITSFIRGLRFAYHEIMFFPTERNPK